MSRIVSPFPFSLFVSFFISHDFPFIFVGTPSNKNSLNKICGSHEEYNYPPISFSKHINNKFEPLRKRIKNEKMNDISINQMEKEGKVKRRRSWKKEGL